MFVPDGGDLPDGIYQITATEAYLKGAGVSYWKDAQGV